MPLYNKSGMRLLQFHFSHSFVSRECTPNNFNVKHFYHNTQRLHIEMVEETKCIHKHLLYPVINTIYGYQAELGLCRTTVDEAVWAARDGVQTAGVVPTRAIARIWGHRR